VGWGYRHIAFVPQKYPNPVGKVCVLVKVCVLPGIFQSKRVEFGWKNVVTGIKKKLWAFFIAIFFYNYSYFLFY
jgi:hypothetical protein